MTLYYGEYIPIRYFPLIARAVSEWSGSQDEKVRGGLLGKSPEQIVEQLFNSRCVVLMDSDVVVGFATCYELTPDHWELGTVVVNPSYRGQGHARRIYEGIILLHRSLGGTLWETTKSDAVVHLSKENGIMPASFETVPANVYPGLCQEANCFVAALAPQTLCAKSAENGGPCTLCVRSEAAVPSSP